MSATPILDLETEPPAPASTKWRSAIGLLIGAAIGLSAGVADIRFTGVPGFNLLLWIPAIYVAIALHELGHLAAGRLAGMAPGGLIIGGFATMKTGSQWTFRFNFRSILSGGSANILPAKGEFRPARYAWMVAGGPLASLLLTLVCGVAFSKYGSGAADWIGSLFWAAAMTLLSLVPTSVGVNQSDGRRLWMLFRNPGRSRSWMAVLAVQTEDAKGVRPRDWDAELFDEMLSGDPAASEQPYLQLLAYYRRADERDEAGALEHLEKALAASKGAGKVLRQCLFFEAAGACAHVRRDSAKARVWRDLGLKLRKPESTAGVEASIAICEGRFNDAIEQITEARSFLASRKVVSGLARFAREHLDDQERLCRQSSIMLAMRGSC